MHVLDKFPGLHGVSNFLPGIFQIFLLMFWCAVDFGLGYLATCEDFPVEACAVWVCGHVWDEAGPVFCDVECEVVGCDVEDVFGGGLVHGFACDLLGGLFFTACDGEESDDFIWAELVECVFDFFDVAVADGDVFLWFAAVGDFAEVR